MRIAFRIPGYIWDKNARRRVPHSAVADLLSTWRYDKECLYNYLDMDLVDLGVTGGRVSAANNENGVELLVEYWVPRPLTPEQLARLEDDTRGQLQDGIGEPGFEIANSPFVLMSDTSQQFVVEQFDDGVTTPLPSTVAIAARDGDTVRLLSALKAGESPEGELQGYTALHLAILYAQADAALALIEAGANPNRQTKDGDTPLRLCAAANSLNDAASAQIATALLRHGADPTSINAAMPLAESRGKAKLLGVLIGASE